MFYKMISIPVHVRVVRTMHLCFIPFHSNIVCHHHPFQFSSNMNMNIHINPTCWHPQQEESFPPHDQSHWASKAQT